MAIHTTRYRTENGKTRKVKSPAKQAGGGASGSNSGADNKNNQPERPVKQGT